MDSVILERVLLDASADPIDLPLSLLKSITNDFSDDRNIGSGGFASVYKGILSNGTVAVKMLNPDIDEKSFAREVTSLMRVKHNNVVRFLGYCCDTKMKLENYKGKMVMADVRQRLLCFEFMPNGGLDKYIDDASRGLDWRTRSKIIKGICKGLDYLHQKNIVHSDLKPTNILLDQHIVPKIADFGLAKCFDDTQTPVMTSNISGSWGYMAPESYSGLFTGMSDIYSLGVIIREILTGEKGYLDIDNVLENWRSRFKTSKESTWLKHVQLYAEISIKCTDYNPVKRPRAKDIMKMLDEIHSMDRETGGGILECVLLDASADPIDLPLSLLKSITNDFSDDRNIGSGGFASVYKGILSNGTVAVKRLNPSVDIDEKSFTREVTSLMRVKHNNVVRFLGYCGDTQMNVENYEGNVVMADVRERLLCFEFMPKGGLDKYVADASRGPDWRTRYQIIKGICKGLHYLHQKNIVHSDLKPANILLDQHMVPKIADFGLAKCFDETQTRVMTSNIFGSLGYMAPESYGGLFTRMSDIYSLGVIINEILTGKKDYLDIDNVLENWRSRFETSKESTWLEHVKLCAEIGIKCIDFNPVKRPRANDIMKMLDEIDCRYGFIEIGICTSSATTTGKTAFSPGP